MRLGKLIQETCPKLWEQLKTLIEQDDEIDDELSKKIVIEDGTSIKMYNDLEVTIQHNIKVIRSNKNEIVITQINNLYASELINGGKNVK